VIEDANFVEGLVQLFTTVHGKSSRRFCFSEADVSEEELGSLVKLFGRIPQIWLLGAQSVQCSV